MEEKYIEIVKEAEGLFEKIMKKSFFSQEKKTNENYHFMHEDRKIVNVSLTNKT